MLMCSCLITQTFRDPPCSTSGYPQGLRTPLRVTSELRSQPPSILADRTSVCPWTPTLVHESFQKCDVCLLSALISELSHCVLHSVRTGGQRSLTLTHCCLPATAQHISDTDNNNPNM